VTTDRAHSREIAYMDQLETRVPRLRAFASEVYAAWESQPTRTAEERMRKASLEDALIILGMQQDRLQELREDDEREFREFLGLTKEVDG
jgi:hypothetical protein